MAKVRLTLLGGFSLHIDGFGESAPPSGKARGLIAIVALSPNFALTQERICGLLWSGRAEAQARDSLKHAVADIRKRLAGPGADWVQSDQGEIRFSAGSMTVDMREFQELLAKGTQADLRSGLAMFRGELLEGISIRDAAFEDWLREQRAKVRLLAETCAARLLAMAQKTGQTDAIVDAAEQLLGLDPMREDASRALMRAFASRGDRAAALRTFANLRDRMAQELGVAPDPETRSLETVIREGPVDLKLGAVTSQSPASNGPAIGMLLPEKPSIAVMQFRNSGGALEHEYLADGIVEDIVNALAHYRWFFVIARNSSFVFGDRKLSIKQIARELGVRYILDGSIRRSGARVRVTSELIEAETGLHLWGERYDREIADIFAIQDDLTRHVVAAIEPEILLDESRRAVTKPTTNLDAYDCHMRGLWHHNQQGRNEDFLKAILWQRRAIELDPTFARAYMLLARSISVRCIFGYSDDIARDGAETSRVAARAIALEDRDAYSHYAMFLGHFLSRRPAAALASAELAIEINPSLSLAHHAVGWGRIFVGRFADALEPLETAMRLSPRDPVSYHFLSRIALAHYHLCNYELAVRYSERALSLRRPHSILVVLLASLGQLGRLDEARVLLPEVVVNTPPDVVGYWKMMSAYVDPAHSAHLFEGLNKAGLEN